MADEIIITSGISARKGNVNYVSQNNRFTSTVAAAVAKGPCPGAITVAADGTDVDLSQLTAPGWGRIENIGADGGNDFDWGVWDPEGSQFVIVGRLSPGESVTIRLAPDFGSDYGATGTGARTNRLRLKGIGGAAVAFCGFFES